MSCQIAIDGPAGAGKSTIAKRIAGELGFIYVDTGALYRALAVFFLSRGYTADNAESAIDLLPQAEVSLSYEDGVQHVLLNGEDITGRLRAEETGEMASVTSAFPEVRKKLLGTQQEIAKTHDVVMDGRDIGTTILPDADLKIFLTASPEERAKRRLLQLRESGQDGDFEEIREDIIRRDERDMTRSESPLVRAEDAVYLDSSDLTIDEVCDTILSLFRERVNV